LLDRDLAELYDVPTEALNQAARRRVAGLPGDFMFQLSKQEFQNWSSAPTARGLAFNDWDGTITIWNADRDQNQKAVGRARVSGWPLPTAFCLLPTAS